jgi:hypothetical protein
MFPIVAKPRTKNWYEKKPKKPYVIVIYLFFQKKKEKKKRKNINRNPRVWLKDGTGQHM